MKKREPRSSLYHIDGTNREGLEEYFDLMTVSEEVQLIDPEKEYSKAEAESVFNQAGLYVPVNSEMTGKQIIEQIKEINDAADVL